MARLIDADNIISVCEILSEKGNDPHYWNQLISIIEDMPTINAIPVKWLEDRIYDMKRAPLYRRYTEMLLIEWLQEQKEQEAVKWE